MYIYKGQNQQEIQMNSEDTSEKGILIFCSTCPSFLQNWLLDMWKSHGYFILVPLLPDIPLKP
jgi:hypothetical protein